MSALPTHRRAPSPGRPSQPHAIEVEARPELDDAPLLASKGVALTPPRTHRRYVIAALCLWITTICYADRTNIGIAIPAFVDSKEAQGQVLSAFFYGYMVTQVPGGFLATKFGAKRVLLTGVVVWTLFDLSTVLASHSLPILFLARVGMGIGEGILFPCMHQIAGAWYPLHERSRLVAIVSGGSDLGTVLAMVVSPALMAAWGWPRIFECFAVLSFAWVLVYTLVGESRPDDDPRISSHERAYILATRKAAVGSDPTHVAPSGAGPTSTRHDYATGNRSLSISSTVTASASTSRLVHELEPASVLPSSSSSSSSLASSLSHDLDWHALLRTRAAWAVYSAHFSFNYGWYVLLGWIPQYFNQVLHIDLGAKGFTAAIPYLSGYVGVLVFGRLADAMIARGHRVLHVRQAVNALGFFGAALFMFLLRFATTVETAVLLLSLTLFMGRAALAGYWVNMIDIAPQHAAHVMAVSNTIATVPGILGNVITGQILEATNRWDVVFGIASGMLVMGGILFHCLASDQPIYGKSRGAAGGVNTHREDVTTAVRNDDHNESRFE